MYWIARLESGTDHHYMNVTIQDCPYSEAERLAQRQNLKYSEDLDRPMYKLVSLVRYTNSGKVAK